MSKLIQIQPDASSGLSKLHQQFNSSISSIDSLKTSLALVRKEMDLIYARIASDLIPLEKKLLNLEIQQVLRLDRVYQQNSLKKRDNDTLSELILERAEYLLNRMESEELSALFTRHNNGISFDEKKKEEQRIRLEQAKQSFTATFDENVEEDVDLDSPEKFQAYADQKFAEREEARQAHQANRKKTPKELSNEEKQRKEKLNLNRTSREIYRELVKNFHPDRERDEAEKGRKTELMHLITEAYEKNDLFELLRLRLVLLGTDLEHSSEQTLKYYIKLLTQQISELQEELQSLRQTGKVSVSDPSLYDRFGTDPRSSMEQKFKREVSSLKKIIRNTEKSLPFYEDEEQIKFLVNDHRQR